VVWKHLSILLWHAKQNLGWWTPIDVRFAHLSGFPESFCRTKHVHWFV